MVIKRGSGKSIDFQQSPWRGSIGINGNQLPHHWVGAACLAGVLPDYRTFYRHNVSQSHVALYLQAIQAIISLQNTQTV
jgi:hypothetical protein